MRILYVSQYFPPEIGAPAARVHELSRHWAGRGHDVTVLTAFPNHPRGEIPAEYRRAFRRGTMTETVNSVRVVRVALYPSPNRFPVERILNYSSFFASACLRGCFLPRPDVVIGTSPQLLVGLAARWLSVRYGCPFVFEVRDLWPESLPASGVGDEGSLVYRALRRIALYLYRSADLIVAVTEPIARRIAEHRPRGAVEVIENGVDVEQFRFLGNREDLKAGLGLANRFVVSYIGTVGLAHGLDVLLEAAKRIRDRKKIAFLVLGEGADRDRLERRVRDEGIENVSFRGPRRREEIPSVISASDVCLVLLRRSELFQTVLPSKMLEFMACECAVVLGVGGFARMVLERGRAGVFVPPEDPGALAAAVLRLFEDPSLARAYGENGRRFVREHFRREDKAEAYLACMERLITS